MSTFKPIRIAAAAGILLASAGLLSAGTATNVTGLYYTGVANNGSLLAGGSQELSSHWNVTYSTEGNNYEGSAYVVGGSYIDGGWVQNTANAQWIVPPGARTSSDGNSGTANLGGDYLPGNGTGNNMATYVYTLAFTISGTGSGAVTNNVSITLTLAADDQAKVYINPTLNANDSINTGSSTLGASLSAAWGNTQAITLKNFGSGANANFKIGTNYLVVQVDNTNSLTGDTGSDPRNPSGLLVYQVGTVATIDGNPVPEVGAWLPLLGGLGLFAYRRLKKTPPAVSRQA